MKLAIALIGIIFMVSAYRGTQDDLFTLIKGDFTGANSFIPWVGSLVFLYAIGFIPGFRPVSRGLMVLVILVLFLKRGTGFFSQLNSQLGIR